MNKYTSIELFAGAGGLAIGFEKAGFHNLLLNEQDKNACKTLTTNRKNWNVFENDIKLLSVKDFVGKVDIVTGGFPCQAFSQSGKRLGFKDTRGTLFYEFARIIDECKPTCFLAENVKGLLNHDNGKTLKTIIDVFSELGYFVFDPLLLNANNYGVAQKRERVFIFGVKKDLQNKFVFSSIPKTTSPNLKDILFAGKYYKKDVSMLESNVPSYSNYKKSLFEKIKPGENWKNLPESLQKEYLGNMFFSEGGKTGILKKLSWEEPCLTILTNPSQKQTERCHPELNRPLSIRESARVQSFPDDWVFCGSVSSQYKQIGNAVPVNLAYNVGKFIINQLIKNEL